MRFSSNFRNDGIDPLPAHRMMPLVAILRLAQSQKCDFQKMRITRHTEHLQTKSAHVRESSRCALSNGITGYIVGATITELTYVKKSNSI